jgi:hypothetical protein
VLGMAHLERRAKRVPVQGRTEKRMIRGRIQNLQSCVCVCVCVFAPHVAFDHEIHVATSHAWVSFAVPRSPDMWCRIPQNRTATGTHFAWCRPAVRVRLPSGSSRRVLTPTSPSNSPTAIQGVLPMCRWLGKFQISLSRTGRRRVLALSHVKGRMCGLFKRVA